MSATKQAHALHAVIGLIHATKDATSHAAQSSQSEEHAKSTAVAAGPWAAKNTIVRDVLNELTNAMHAPKQRRTNVVKLTKQDVPKVGNRSSPKKRVHEQ